MNGKEEVGMNNIPSFFFFLWNIYRKEEKKDQSKEISVSPNDDYSFHYLFKLNQQTT
jgi:hypothetical protein